MDLDGLDPATRRLVVEIQLQDLQSLQEDTNRKGKGREGEMTGLGAALDAYKIELAEAAQLLHDETICRSVSRAVSLDADLIRIAVLEEEQARRDREIALDLGGENNKPKTDGQEALSGPYSMWLRHHSTNPEEEDSLTEKLKALYVGSLDDEEEEELGNNPGESSSWAAGRPSTNKTEKKQRECVACTEKFLFFDLASCAGCAHEYCRDCLQSVFEVSLTDDSYFPPRCCRQPMTIESCRPYLPSGLVERFRAKKMELDTPNRTYCSKPACSAWVPLQSIVADLATCQKCNSKTCVFCKGPFHGTATCPQDASAQALLDLAAQEGWQRCYNCKRVVELRTGCNHITCPCQAEFCYVCGKKWKTCRCEQFDQDRLLERAEAVVDRRRDAQRIPDVQRENLVRREMEHLRANHQCEHARWRSRGGRHQCEECHDTLPNYILECTQCRLMACRRCRYNRL
ncbi:hypothetical protein B0H66DRAFT_519 [Apodospora peruviana]|uniref:RBR-type E3 ubiquitin transferase n=1 Tax=Apodospora peruviana TaxID=516989 RepID=A0AAE0MDS5_9PEZI|nr:hypothetical protein B0H66DRAFT_519 [Apodospora peruviana]